MRFETFKDVIIYAVQQEAAALSFYEKAAEMAKDPLIRKIFAGLAAEEMRHKKQLYQLDQEKVGNMPFPGGEERDIGKSISFMEFRAKMTAKEILEYAINAEESAEHLYMVTAKQTSEPELKKLMLILANEERRHKEKLLSFRDYPAFADKLSDQQA